MILKKEGFPEINELVLCTVTSVQYHSVAVDLDEYHKSGLIHISEVSPGRIRNIRDFVKEKKKIVCKVLRINKEKGYIDLSLRRVNESEKKRKINEIKREQDAVKIIEISAEKIGEDSQKLYDKISKIISKDYSSLYDFFERIVKGETTLGLLGLDKKDSKIIDEIIKQRIKALEVEIKGKLKITTFAPNGIDIIKEALKKAELSAQNKICINYLGSGTYLFIVKGVNYKEVETIMKNSTEAAMGLVTKNSGMAEFSRESA